MNITPAAINAMIDANNALLDLAESLDEHSIMRRRLMTAYADCAYFSRALLGTNEQSVEDWAAEAKASLTRAADGVVDDRMARVIVASYNAVARFH
jgi:hypothetical protein